MELEHVLLTILKIVQTFGVIYISFICFSVFVDDKNLSGSLPKSVPLDFGLEKTFAS